MRAFEIWPKLSKELNHEILETACLHEKQLYRHTVRDLSEAMRKRMPAVLELPRAARHELFQPLLGWSKFDVLGHNLVINWLRVAGEPMMVAFLDAVEVRHDGRGCTENFPATVAAAKLATACQLLYEKFPAEKVTLYLQLFPNISGVTWNLEQHLKV